MIQRLREWLYLNEDVKAIARLEQILVTSSLTSRTTIPHPFHCALNYTLCSLLDQYCVRYFASACLEMIVIGVEHQTIDVDLGDTQGDALLHKLRFESVRPMQNNSHSLVDT